MKRPVRLLPLFLVLFLFGCSPRTIEATAPLLTGVDGDGNSQIEMIAGETLSLPIVLPELKKAESTLRIEAQTPLSAEQSGGDLVISCEKTGSFSLKLIIEAEKYEPMTVSYQVEVAPRPMALSVLDADGNLVTSVSLVRGETAVFTLSSEPGAIFGATNPGPSSCDARIEGSTLTITANETNDSSVLLVARLEGYTTAKLLLPIAVTAVPAELSVPQTILSGLVGDTLSITCAIDPEGILTASCDAAVTATVTGGKATFTSSQAGRYQVILTVEAPGDLPTSQTIEVSFEQPLVSLTAPKSVSLSAGGSTAVTVTATSGASIWVESSGVATAAITSDGTLTISADKKGNGTVTVGASKDGYRDATASIAVTASVALPSSSNRYASEALEIAELVNQERAANGLGALTYRQNLEGLAQLRAQEAEEYWSHTRPDGRDFNTVFSDYDLHYLGEGENLFAANLLDVDLAMDEWMDSPDHRANILRSNLNGISVGIIKGSDGDFYYCQLFVTD